jgi:DNA-binding response OmpR family regulator
MAEVKKKILLVDDERAILKILSIKLRVSGYEVLTALNGEEALELVVSAAPDLVLLDIIMPGIDGFEVLRRVPVATLPVIVFSARSENSAEALRLGARAFIAKPFNVDHLVAEIRKALNGKQG